MKIIFLLLLISCGKPDAEFQQCYSREDAIRACMVDEMRSKQIPSEEARLICEPLYITEGCYYL